MMDHPEEYIQRFAQGAWNITVHEEIEADLSELLDRIHECGVHTGISLKPATPVSRVVPFLSQADMILIMTVEPGFGGQSFQREMLGKLRELRRIGYQGLLEADGGLTLNNLPDLKQAGLDVAVMGTAIYRSEHPADDIRRIHSL
jgi:ribulose-phosphate 3-epimerase